MTAPLMDMSSLNLGMPTFDAPDRSSTLTPDSVIPNWSSAGVIVVVDPVSTGACLSRHLSELGHRLVRVWSDTCPSTVKNHTKTGTEVDYVAEVQVVTGDLSAAVAAIRKHAPIHHVMVGCESGVRVADQLSHALNVVGNGIALSGLRRHKFDQIEAVREYGLDAPLQKLATSSSDVEEWLSSASFPVPFRAVVKPVEGAGSDGVSICDTPAQVRAAYAALEGTSNVLGLTNYEVLLQEFLQGDEFVIDTVSADGVHKCVAIWKYDKRVANNSPVVYFGMHLLAVDASPRLRGMVDYVLGVLEALGIRWGAMHSEVKLEARGPVLVEVNCRLHGGEGIWLPISQACLGYTQVSAMADAYLNPQAFAALPSLPFDLQAHGAWVTIRSSATGVITAISEGRLGQIRALKSYRDEYLPLGVGSAIVTTIDACTVHGCFNLAHEDAEQMARDYELAQALVEEGLFEVGPADVQ